MAEIWQQFVEQFLLQSGLELLAVVFSIAYVWLAAEQKIWCWPSALISTSLFTYIFWDVNLVFQMLLNAYYAIMAIVGWYSWQKKGKLAVHGVAIMSIRQHILLVVFGALVTLLIVNFASHWLNYENLFLDAAITVYSLLVTWLTVRKYLQSWIYWIVINTASIYLFWQASLYFAVLLMIIYIVLAIRGFIQWRSDHLLLTYQNA